MSRIGITYTLKRVEPVISIIEDIVEDFDFGAESTGIYVEAFATKFISGYHMSNMGGERRCNVVGGNKGDGFRFNIGHLSDYHPDSRAALNTVEFYYYEHNEHYALARDICNWVLAGTKPTRTATTFF